VEVVDLIDSDQDDPPSDRQAAEDGLPGVEGECANDLTLRLCYGSV